MTVETAPVEVMIPDLAQRASEASRSLSRTSPEERREGAACHGRRAGAWGVRHRRRQCARSSGRSPGGCVGTHARPASGWMPRA